MLPEDQGPEEPANDNFKAVFRPTIFEEAYKGGSILKATKTRGKQSVEEGASRLDYLFEEVRKLDEAEKLLEENTKY